MKLSKLLREIKGVFKPPKKYYYIGKIQYGCPYFYPINFNSTIISFRKLQLKSSEEIEKYTKDYPYLVRYNDGYKFKNMPMVRRAKDRIFKLFNNYYWIEIGYPIKIHKNELGWKDKFESPRYEWSPAFYIFFFKWQFCMWWNAPKSCTNNDTNRYYEQILWYVYYAHRDIVKAKETWPWSDYKTKVSTWDDKYLV